ncbi:hypothetical protein AB0M48_38780 [Lentzea sp. NPDC051208]|uniref:hypothetical protein n=1 Tax=Lentzea sp. NPDC051208 TaxID=3154642 RepID=UPI00341A47C9
MTDALGGQEALRQKQAAWVQEFHIYLGGFIGPSLAKGWEPVSKAVTQLVVASDLDESAPKDVLSVITAGFYSAEDAVNALQKVDLSGMDLVSSTYLVKSAYESVQDNLKIVIDELGKVSGSDEALRSVLQFQIEVNELLNYIEASGGTLAVLDSDAYLDRELPLERNVIDDDETVRQYEELVREATGPQPSSSKSTKKKVRILDPSEDLMNDPTVAAILQEGANAAHGQAENTVVPSRSRSSSRRPADREHRDRDGRVQTRRVAKEYERKSREESDRLRKEAAGRVTRDDTRSTPAAAQRDAGRREHRDRDGREQTRRVAKEYERKSRDESDRLRKEAAGRVTRDDTRSTPAAAQRDAGRREHRDRDARDRHQTRKVAEEHERKTRDESRKRK